MDYKSAAVASTFSPRFFAVLAEAHRLASHFGAGLEVVHAAHHDGEKEGRFKESFQRLGREAEIHWGEGKPPAETIIAIARREGHDLLIAGALERQDDGRNFTSSVARELLRHAPCDLLLIPNPADTGTSLEHIVFGLEPEGDGRSFLQKAVRKLKPTRVTLAITETPFAAAIAASRGESPRDVEAWTEELADAIEDEGAEVEIRIVNSNTGFVLCDVIKSLDADLLVVRAECSDKGRTLPMHMDWLHQVIPTRLLVVREN